jgi:DNA polymerase-3 subunit delta
MTYAEVKAAIKKQKFEPAYLLYGDNQYRIDELARAITSAAVAPGFLSFDRNVLYSDELSPESLVSALETPPMASPRRVVILNGVEKLPERLGKTLLEYLARPGERTVLVATSSEQLKKKAFLKNLAAKAAPVQLNNLNESNSVEWIRERVASLGWSIDEDGARVLYNSVGSDQSYLASEIDKLTICAGDNKKITAEDVALVAGKSRQNTIFDLTDAIGELEPYRSVALVNNLLAWRENTPSKILYMISRQMYMLLELKSLRRRRVPDTEIRQRQNFRFFLEKLEKQASRFTQPQLRRILRLLQAAESRIKSSGSGDVVELESLIYRICREVSQ